MNKTNGMYKSSSVEEIRKSIDSAIEKIFSYMDSENFKNYLKCLSRFHSYSLGNSILIALQKPDSTMVAGYTTWKNQFGRQVRKGEKAIRILALAPSRNRPETKWLRSIIMTRIPEFPWRTDP